MKITHIITALEYGGAERLLLNSLEKLCALHDVEVIYLKGNPRLLDSFLKIANVIHIPFGRGCAKALRRHLLIRKPDIVHTHLGHADLVGLWASRGLPLRRFCTMHNIWFKWDWRDNLIFSLYRMLFKTVARNCTVVSISDCVARHVVDKLGMPPARVATIRNAIPNLDVNELNNDLRLRLGIPLDAFVVLYIGRLKLQKSVDTLIRAAHRVREPVPELHVAVVGEGEELEKLETLRVQLGLQRTVTFYGTTDRPELFLAAADSFVLPSIFEGFGIVILEAFRAGLPVVATDIEGPSELIDHNVNGLLFPPGDDRALSEHLITLHRDKVLRDALGIAAKHSFSQEYTIDTYVDRLEGLYLGPSRQAVEGAR